MAGQKFNAKPSQATKIRTKKTFVTCDGLAIVDGLAIADD